MSEDDRLKYLEELMQPHIPLRVLQEIRQEIDELCITIQIPNNEHIDDIESALNKALEIIDKHIKEIEEC